MRILLLLFLMTTTHYLLALDLELNMGLGLYYSGAKGQIDYVGEAFKGSNAKADLTTSTNVYVWGDLKSRNPYLPRARFEYLKVSVDGDSKASFVGDGALFDLINDAGYNNQDWNSHLQHNMYDFILYYDFLTKSVWPSVGFGMGYRYFDYIYIMDIDVLSDISGIQFGDRDSSSAPMAYFNTRYEAPSINMGFEADAKVYLSDSQIYDWRVKMDLLFEIEKDVTAGIEFGYRQQYYSLAGGDVENVKGHMHYQGVFIGGTLRFK